MAVHVPAVQVSDVVHVFPQEPQFELSVWVSTHAELHSVPMLHVQTLLMQVALVGHTLLHMPQLFESLVVSTQFAPHIVPAQVLVLPLSCCCGGGWLGPLSCVGLLGIPESCMKRLPPPASPSVAN
jgi:hypothetical protein